MLLHITVVPRSQKPGIQSISTRSHDYLRVKVRSVPEKGKANTELCQLLADHFKVRRSSVRIVRGLRSREKIVEILE